jgi:2-iminobutanoate/2-iminopropanoate deaminase
MSKTIIETSQAPAPIGPYSQAVMSGNMLFVSGQIALDPSTGHLVQGSIEEETHQVLKNLGAIITQAGLGFHHVVKCSIFIRDMGQFGAINEVYGKYFQVNPPARETVEVSCLPKNVNVEISCIAVG